MFLEVLVSNRMNSKKFANILGKSGQLFAPPPPDVMAVHTYFVC